MKLYVWEYCVNRDYTPGDLCVMASSLQAARNKAAAAYARREFSIDDESQPPWELVPDKVLAAGQAVHASPGGA